MAPVSLLGQEPLLEPGRFNPLTGHHAQVNSVAFAPDGHTLATASWDQTVLLWDVTDPSRPRRLGDPLTGHTSAVSSVAFAPDGHTLATASADKTVRLWDVTDPGQPHDLGDFLTGYTEAETMVAFAPDGHPLPTARWDRTVLLWDLTGLIPLRDQPMKRACAITRRGLDPI